MNFSILRIRDIWIFGVITILFIEKYFVIKSVQSCTEIKGLEKIWVR